MASGRRLRAGQGASAGLVTRILEEMEAMASGVSEAFELSEKPRAFGADGGGAETVYLPAGADRGTLGAEWAALLATSAGGMRALEAGTGMAAFRVGSVGLAVIPPFPITAAGIRGELLRAPGIHGGPLLALLEADYTVGVAIVRLGRYAIAVYEGQRLVVSKTDRRYVKGRHHAGGTSQRRFQRVREWQIHRLYAEAAEILQRQWQPYLGRLDYVALGGEAATVAGFVKECGLLNALAPITLGRRLEVREPNRAALEGSVKAALYECRLYPLGGGNAGG